jgi:hypothetical protein
MKDGRGMKGKGMEPCTYFHHSFANHSLARFFPVEQAGLAQSRQGAKEEGDELRELKLWVAGFDLFLFQALLVCFNQSLTFLGFGIICFPFHFPR